MSSRRDNSIDLLRGAVMCLMVLDHARDFATTGLFSPTDAAKTTVALFFTRWITHFCAPVFMLLAGAGTGLAQRAGRSTSWLVQFLLSRGLWLLVLEMTLVRFGWTFNLNYQFATGQVIWALGWSMIFLALLVPLGPKIAGAIGFAIVVLHNLLDPLKAADFGRAAPLWQILHTAGPVALGPNHTLFVAYPLVPWIGVIALGYLLGASWSALDRKKLLALGAICLGAFFIIRGIDHYGDPHPRDLGLGGARAIFSFLDCQKYPPSLDYLLMTLGPALLVLGILRGRALDGAFAKILVVYGRAPLFFYLLHLPLVHAMTIPLRASQHLELITGAFQQGLVEPLWVAYAIWLGALVILYFPTRAWARLKAERDTWWLRYL